MVEAFEQSLPENNPEEGKKITKPQDLVRLYDIIIQVSQRTCLEVCAVALGRPVLVLKLHCESSKSEN